MTTTTAIALAAADRAKLARLLGMLGSDFDGEALAAARLADRLVRSRGATWVDVVMPTVPAVTEPKVRRERRERKRQQAKVFNPLDDWPEHWREAAIACIASGIPLDGWTRDFLSVLVGYRNVPSVRQLDILREVAAKILAGGAKR